MFTVCSKRIIKGSVEEVFDACRSVDVQAEGGAVISLNAVGGRTCGLSELGDLTTWSAHFSGIRSWVTTEIVRFDKPARLDVKWIRGTFTTFHHVFEIKEEAGIVILKNTVTYKFSKRLLRRLFTKTFILPPMIRSQERRLDTVKRVVEEDIIPGWRTITPED